MFNVEENGVLYLSIGFSEAEEGLMWYDMAVIHCPFCGAQLQDPESIPDPEAVDGDGPQ